MSPQSLAKTRDKRSHRIPARFDDFIPPEVVNHRNVLELRSKPKKAVPTESEPDFSQAIRVSPPKSEPPAPKKAPNSSKNPSRRSSSSSKSRSKERRTTLPTQQQEQTSPSPPPQPPLQLPLPLPQEQQQEQQQQATATCHVGKNKQDCSTVSSGSSTDLSVELDKVSSETVVNEDGKKDMVIDLECDETSLKIEPEVSTVNKDTTIQHNGIPASKEVEAAVVDAVENKEKTILSKRVDASEIIKKGSPFHPSITISNSYKINQQLTPKPLLDKKTSSSVNTPTSVSQKTVSPRKKSKSTNSIGSSLLKPNNGAFQTNTLINRLPIQQLPQQQTKYFNNLTPNMQYGTRLMLNEQVYLPRSVGNIAPITTTLQQIANQARKPPFISKKAEAYIAYQESRKFNYMTSIYTASVKITKYLDVQDLLNLRLVNKTWKSIIDSDAVWKKVTLSVKDVASWPQFVQTILCRYQTTDLVLEDCFPPTNGKPPYNFLKLLEMFEFIVEADSKLERIWIQTVEPLENKSALEFLSLLSTMDLVVQRFERVQIIWRVKIGIDDFGLATVPIMRHDWQNHDPLPPAIAPEHSSVYVPGLSEVNYYWQFPLLFPHDEIRPKVPGQHEIADGYDPTPVTIELDQLEDFFNNGKKVLRTKSTTNPSPLVLVEPI